MEKNRKLIIKPKTIPSLTAPILHYGDRRVNVDSTIVRQLEAERIAQMRKANHADYLTIEACVGIGEFFGDGEYGIGEKSASFISQHRGLGKKLMAEAEKIAKKEKCQELFVISGVGVRQYYKKLGYSLRGEYMIKKLK